MRRQTARKSTAQPDLRDPVVLMERLRRQVEQLNRARNNRDALRRELARMETENNRLREQIRQMRQAIQARCDELAEDVPVAEGDAPVPEGADQQGTSGGATDKLKDVSSTVDNKDATKESSDWSDTSGDED